MSYDPKTEAVTSARERLAELAAIEQTRALTPFEADRKAFALHLLQSLGETP